MIQLPEGWENFSEEMSKRAKKYIEIGYWDITLESLSLWKKNFITDKEIFLSALIIYRIIYRNKMPRLSMYRDIIERILPNELKKLDFYPTDTLNNFINHIETNPWKLPFRFTTIEGVDKSSSKSGAQLLREFRRFGKFHPKLESNIEDESKSKDKIPIIVIFDDFMGTGNQFEAFLKINDPYRKNLKLIYCPLTAHEEGINYIRTNYPEVIVSPVEILDNNYSFFSHEYMPKISEEIKMEDLRQLYSDVMKRTKLRPEQYFGYGEKSLLYIYDLSSPNNSLPILTYNDQNWTNIFER